MTGVVPLFEKLVWSAMIPPSADLEASFIVCTRQCHTSKEDSDCAFVTLQADIAVVLIKRACWWGAFKGQHKLSHRPGGEAQSPSTSC